MGNYEKDSKQYKPVMKTVENAESYAAAAVEYFFKKKCGFTEIQPVMNVNDNS